MRLRSVSSVQQPELPLSAAQLYLPFIGAALQERYPAPKPQIATLMPTSQQILFRYLYRKEHEMYASGLAQLLGVSAMQVTRAGNYVWL